VKSLLALIAAPGIALAAQSIMFALVMPSCQDNTRLWLHLIALGALLAAGVLAVLAYGEWRARAATLDLPPDDDSAVPANTRRFLAAVAAGVAALSALVVLAMWIAVWVLWPCGQQ
jgi:uncharacterized membrane protein YebE (DUF533 family)